MCHASLTRGPLFPQGVLTFTWRKTMRLSTGVVVLSLLAAGVAPLRAQDVASSIATDSTVAIADTTPRTTERLSLAIPQESAAVGAPMTGLRAGVHARETSRPDRPTVMLPQHANLGQARAMMVVGVAALIAGAIIGDTPGQIVMIGGAVIGLIGLYDYLQ
jgi:hypothetical protein